MDYKFRLRFLAWLVIIISSSIVFGTLIFKGFPLNTNVLSLLPQKQVNPAFSAASEAFSSRMGNKVIFLISAPDEDQAIKATEEFSDKLKQSQLFKHIFKGVNEAEQQSWGTFYFPYRLQLLKPSDEKLLVNNNENKIVENALVSLYSPMGIANRKLLDNDPFFLYQNYLLSLPRPSSALDLHKGYLTTKYGERWYVMLQTQISGNSFSLTTQEAIIKAIDSATAEISQNGVKVLRTGMLFYAQNGSDTAQHEVSTIGVGSLVGIILLVLFTFRSLRPLVFTLVSVASGFIVAFVVTYLWFGSVFLFTLVFGASLIGISVDYAFFYYSERLLGDEKWTPALGFKRIFWGITLGLLNVIISFIVISIAPFPGLHQLAVFAITGLSISYLTVICLFPYVIQKTPTPNKKPILLICSDKYLEIWKNISKVSIVIILTIIALVIIAGNFQVKANDDIHILESASQELKNTENTVKKITGSNMGMSYLIVLADNNEILLQRANNISEKIYKEFSNINNPLISISDYIPNVYKQKNNYDLVKKLISTQLINYLEKIGYDNSQAQKVKKNLDNISFKQLTLDSWLDAPVSQQLKFLWLGDQEGQKAMAITLSERINLDQLESIVKNQEGVYLVNKADEISDIFAHYRVMINNLLFLVAALLWILLSFRYSFKKAFIYLITPVLACSGALGILGWFDIPLTLFSLLALILVLGISMDYVIFLAESKKQYQSTMLALLLSAITTVLSFGLLSLSSTPAIHYFGLTVLVGIVLAFLLAPLALRLTEYEN
ncbi:MMPL family transporter [Francisella frigiditurris]|uniref:MMPL family protein n=1 Tax=Francisella frigiditurris TaxID=1542390 RepID=A0A1J0KUD2_9GAMM|nr:MMPL family transporter [Francisella frigiditurris]APC97381.1 MMPL family protein [Francisella frigiditurris]